MTEYLKALTSSLRWDSVQSGRSVTTFHRILLPLSSDYRGKWFSLRTNAAFYQFTRRYVPDDSYISVMTHNRYTHESTMPLRYIGEKKRARDRRVVSFTSRPLYPSGMNQRYSLSRTLGEPHCLSGCSGGSSRIADGNRTMILQLYSPYPRPYVDYRARAQERRQRVRAPEKFVFFFFGPPSKGGPAKNIYTKSERTTLSCRVTRVWTERASLYNRQIMSLPRKTKTYLT